MKQTRPNSIIGVVDDDQRVLESLQNLLESADYEVRLFSSARALLESAYLPEIDCVISDIDMPMMDGFELMRVIQAKRPELPIILITGHPELLNELPPMEAGRHRLFRKPFDGQELLTTVANALRNPK